MILFKHLTLALLSLTLAACVQSGRYKIKHDKAPLRKPTTLEMQSPTPIYEEIYPRSTVPYTIDGKRYIPLKSATGYKAKGIASWYGRKFHGHSTANGEIYNMFAMSAAHTTLPIPSYVKVTNLSNKKSIIVRVNDRGPFHSNRIIDLSYAAAYALDMLKHGTTHVMLESITVPEHEPEIRQIATTTDASEQLIDKKPPLNATVELKPQPFVQVVAGKNRQKLQRLAQQLSIQYQQNHDIEEQNGLYKLRLGPLQSEPQAQALKEALQINGYPGAYMLYSKARLPHN